MLSQNSQSLQSEWPMGGVRSGLASTLLSLRLRCPLFSSVLLLLGSEVVCLNGLPVAGFSSDSE